MRIVKLRKGLDNIAVKTPDSKPLVVPNVLAAFNAVPQTHGYQTYGYVMSTLFGLMWWGPSRTILQGEGHIISITTPSKLQEVALMSEKRAIESSANADEYFVVNVMAASRELYVRLWIGAIP